MRPFAHRQRGSTLIEVLMAVLLLSFGLLGELALLRYGHQVSVSAEDSNRASLLSSEFATSIMTTQTAGGTITTPDLAYWSARAASAVTNGSFVFTPSSDAKTATVQVYWKPTSAASSAASDVYTTRLMLVGP